MWGLIVYYLGLKLYNGVSCVCFCVCMCMCEGLVVFISSLTQKDCGKIILKNFPLPQLKGASNYINILL